MKSVLENRYHYAALLTPMFTIVGLISIIIMASFETDFVRPILQIIAGVFIFANAVGLLKYWNYKRMCETINETTGETK